MVITSASIHILIMTKLLYLIPCLLAPFLVFHDQLLSTGSSFLRVKPKSVNENMIPPSINVHNDENDPASSSSESILYTPEAMADKVTNLPGLQFDPTFSQFSGYLQVSPTRRIHYWFIESMNNPSEDPVVFWTNGGPGCSGLLGLGTEMGPFIFNSGGKLTLNPYTWNNIANILYVEQPAGVGFSSFTSPDDAKVGDERAAIDNYELIQQFFNRFPEKKQNDFYIASESFGGHYIPHLAKTIIDMSETDNSITNFRGFLVGNPYVDPFTNLVTMIQTYYMHGLVPLPLFAEWESKCLDKHKYDNELCNNLVDEISYGAGKGINPYALDFPACTEPDNNDYPPQEDEIASEAEIILNGVGDYVSSSRRRQMLATSQLTKLINSTSITSPPFLPKEDVYHPCAEAHLYQYLNRDDVKKALHVDLDRKWSMCTNEIQYSEKDSNKPQMYLYEELVAYGKKKGSNLKMMVFSGDDDSVCSTASTQAWIWNIGMNPIQHKLWQPWKVQNQTAGYLTEFNLGKQSDSSFLFVTVHGAGHEVPAYRPIEALALFESYFTGEWDLGR